MTEIRTRLIDPQKVSRDLLADALENRYAFRMLNGAEVQTTDVGLVRFIRLEENSALYKRDDADTVTPHDSSNDPVTIVSQDQIRFHKVTVTAEIADDYRLSPIEIKGFFDETPGDEQNGDIIIVGTSPSGTFAGHAGEYAIKNGSGHTFISPKKMDTVFTGGVLFQYRLDNPDETDDVDVYKWRAGLNVRVINDGSIPHSKLANGTVGNILGFLQSGAVGEIDISQLQVGVAFVSGAGESETYTAGQTKAYDLNAEFTSIDHQSSITVSLTAQGEASLAAGTYVAFPSYYLEGVTLQSNTLKIFDDTTEIRSIANPANGSMQVAVIQSENPILLRVNSSGSATNGGGSSSPLTFNRSSCLILKVA